MDMLELYRIGVGAFDRHVQAIAGDGWSLPTPCADWDVRALVRHLVYETVWIPPLMRGMTVAEVGDRFEGDIIGDDPRAAWERALAEARAVVEEPGALERTVHLSSRDTTGADYIREVAVDAGLHYWDLARAIGGDDTIPAPIVEEAFAWLEPQIEEFRKSGSFGPPVEVPPDADRQTKLLALIGRKA